MRHLLLATSALVAISLPGQLAQDEPSVALLSLQVTDVEGFALPGVSVAAVPAGEQRNASHVRAVTNADGFATVILGSGETMTVVADLIGFIPQEIRGVELAGGFHYSGPVIELEVGEAVTPGWRTWSSLTNPPLPKERSKYGEWFYEQPEEAQLALHRASGVKVMPLTRTPRVVVQLRLGDWDDWGWAKLQFEGPSQAYAQLTEYGEAMVLLDAPGEYDLVVTHPERGTYRLRNLDLQQGNIYQFFHELSNESKSVSWMDLVEEFDVSATTFDGEYVELDPDLMDDDE